MCCSTHIVTSQQAFQFPYYFSLIDSWESIEKALLRLLSSFQISGEILDYNGSCYHPPAFFSRGTARYTKKQKVYPWKVWKPPTATSLSSAKLRGRWYIHVKDHRDQKSWLAEKSDFPPWFRFVNVQNTFESPRVKLFPGFLLQFGALKCIVMLIHQPQVCYISVNSHFGGIVRCLDSLYGMERGEA